MKKSITIATCLIATAVLYWFAEAGNLEPPGPPAPTMKNLGQVEPRIPIQASDLPLTINVSGSYYLAEEMLDAPGNITIQASNVTLDLMGFSLSGGTGHGIFAPSGANLEIKNGSVSDWTGDGVLLSGTARGLISHVRATNNGGSGIETASGSVVVNCVSHGNTGDGFTLGLDNVITGATATSNGGKGIYTGNKAVVSECVSSANGGNGIQSSGIIRNCIARGNGGNGILASAGAVVTGCQVIHNDIMGIQAGGDVRIEGNSARENGFDGILVAYDCLVIDNLSNDNSRIGTGGSGIAVGVTSGARVQGNHVSGNAQGIYVGGTGNIIVGNSAVDNTVNYNIAEGNAAGPIVADPSGAGPWDNFQP